MPDQFTQFRLAPDLASSPQSRVALRNVSNHPSSPSYRDGHPGLERRLQEEGRQLSEELAGISLLPICSIAYYVEMLT
jgi:hypothetical protein